MSGNNNWIIAFIKKVLNQFMNNYLFEIQIRMIAFPKFKAEVAKQCMYAFIIMNHRPKQNSLLSFLCLKLNAMGSFI